jgi:hypothetical protein
MKGPEMLADTYSDVVFDDVVAHIVAEQDELLAAEVAFAEDLVRRVE